MDYPALFAFLAELKANNHKDWFDTHRPQYELLRKEWIHTVKLLIDGINRIDPSLGPLEPKDCIFRINRDIRFSNDKSPYKTNFGAFMASGGKKSFHAGYYIHLEPGEAFIAGGLYMPEPPQLKAVRQEIDYHFESFDQIIHEKSFQQYFGSLGGDTLANIPKGYEKDNPAAEYLKHKSFVAQHKIPESVYTTVSIHEYALNVFAAMSPLVSFLNTALDA